LKAGQPPSLSQPFCCPTNAFLKVTASAPQSLLSWDCFAVLPNYACEIARIRLKAMSGRSGTRSLAQARDRGFLSLHGARESKLPRNLVFLFFPPSFFRLEWACSPFPKGPEILTPPARAGHSTHPALSYSPDFPYLRPSPQFASIHRIEAKFRSGR